MNYDCYNGFDGRKVADFLRKNLVAENEDGKIIKQDRDGWSRLV